MAYRDELNAARARIEELSDEQAELSHEQSRQQRALAGLRKENRRLRLRKAGWLWGLLTAIAVIAIYRLYDRYGDRIAIDKAIGPRPEHNADKRVRIPLAIEHTTAGAGIELRFVECVLATSRESAQLYLAGELRNDSAEEIQELILQFRLAGGNGAAVANLTLRELKSGDPPMRPGDTHPVGHHWSIVPVFERAAVSVASSKRIAARPYPLSDDVAVEWRVERPKKMSVSVRRRHGPDIPPHLVVFEFVNTGPQPIRHLHYQVGDADGDERGYIAWEPQAPPLSLGVTRLDTVYSASPSQSDRIFITKIE